MIGFAVVGYGYWGPNIARCVAEGEGSELRAIVDGSSDARARAARRYPGITVTDDFRSVVDDPKIDAVVIAAPVRFHAELAQAVLRAGKHVLIEKPMAASLTEAYQLVEEAARRRRVLMVDHTFVYTPAVRCMREQVRNGQIGRPHYYDSTRINLGLFQSDVNVVWDLAVHDLAILDFLVDECPVAVSAQAAGHVAGSPESIAFLTLLFESGMVAHINVNWLAPVKMRRTILGGSRKMIVYDDLEPSEKIKIYDKGVSVTAGPGVVEKMRVGYRSGDMWAPQLATTEALRSVIDHFVSCIEQNNRPETDGMAGARIVELLELACSSIAHQGRPVELPRQRLAS